MPATSPFMTLLGIYDTEMKSATKPVIIANVAATGRLSFYYGRGALAERNGHDKQKKKVHSTRKYFSPP